MSGCRVTFGPNMLTPTAAQLRALAMLDGARIVGFFFDCAVRVSGDILIDDGGARSRVSVGGEVVACRS